MMNSRYFIGFLIVVLTTYSSFAQSKKEVLKKKIKSITENVTVYENGKEATYKESYILFNKAGKIIEETTYNKDGSIQKKETFKFDNDKNKLEETYYRDAEEEKKKGVESKKISYKYNVNGDKSEEIEYDGSGKVTKKIVYGYNGLGEKNLETHYNGDGKLLKKAAYTYDNKSLKIKREAYTATNVLESVKKYTYEFF